MQAFAAQENRSPKFSKEQWLQRFLYTEETDAFFYFFRDELHKWLFKLDDRQGTWRLDGPKVWTPELVRHLEVLESNKKESPLEDRTRSNHDTGKGKIPKKQTYHCCGKVGHTSNMSWHRKVALKT